MRLLLVVVVATMAASRLMAIDFDRPLDRAGVRTWSTEQGLPVNSVVDILQDRDGFMWFATEQGLVRFDGVAFEVFDRASTCRYRLGHCAFAGRVCWTARSGPGPTVEA